MGDPLKNTMKALTGQRVSFDPSQAQRVQHCLTTGLVSKKVLLPFFLLHLYASTSEREREKTARGGGSQFRKKLPIPPSQAKIPHLLSEGLITKWSLFSN